MKRFLSILFLGLLLCTAAYAESAEVLDLTALSGNMLTDRLSEIRANPGSIMDMRQRRACTAP